MKTIKAVEAKDITLLETRSKKLVADTRSFKTIKSKDDLQLANEQLKKVGEAKKWIAEKKASVIKPLNEALKGVRDLFRPIEERVSEAETGLKTEVMAYKKKVDEVIAKKQKDIEEKVKKGEVGFEKASEIIERTQEKKDAFNIRKVKEVVIDDEKLLPREYLIPNMPKIKADALAGKAIKGVSIVVKEIPVIK